MPHKYNSTHAHVRKQVCRCVGRGMTEILTTPPEWMRSPLACAHPFAPPPPGVCTQAKSPFDKPKIFSLSHRIHWAISSLERGRVDSRIWICMLVRSFARKAVWLKFTADRPTTTTLSDQTTQRSVRKKKIVEQHNISPDKQPILWRQLSDDPDRHRNRPSNQGGWTLPTSLPDNKKHNNQTQVINKQGCDCH